MIEDGPAPLVRVRDPFMGTKTWCGLRTHEQTYAHARIDTFCELAALRTRTGCAQDPLYDSMMMIDEDGRGDDEDDDDGERRVAMMASDGDDDDDDDDDDDE